LPCRSRRRRLVGVRPDQGDRQSEPGRRRRPPGAEYGLACMEPVRRVRAHDRDRRAGVLR
jgi:hypothetical protein